jgi:hypothetical protein
MDAVLKKCEVKRLWRRSFECRADCNFHGQGKKSSTVHKVGVIMDVVEDRAKSDIQDESERNNGEQRVFLCR